MLLYHCDAVALQLSDEGEGECTIDAKHLCDQDGSFPNFFHRDLLLFTTVCMRNGDLSQ